MGKKYNFGKKGRGKNIIFGAIYTYNLVVWLTTLLICEQEVVEKFKRQVFINNVMRIKAVILGIFIIITVRNMHQCNTKEALREAAKKVIFFIVQSTRRGKGVKGCALRKKNFFSFFLISSRLLTTKPRGGGIKALVDYPLKNDNLCKTTLTKKIIFQKDTLRPAHN